MLYSTHKTSDLDKIADYIVFLNKGRIILNASMEQINENFAVVKGKKELLNNPEIVKKNHSFLNSC